MSVPANKLDPKLLAGEIVDKLIPTLDWTHNRVMIANQIVEKHLRSYAQPALEALKQAAKYSYVTNPGGQWPMIGELDFVRKALEGYSQ